MNLLSTNSKPATNTATAGPSSGPAPVANTAGGMVDRIYDGDRARTILKDLNILDDLRKLDRDDPQYWEKVDRALEKAKAHQQVKAITYQQGPGGIDEDNMVIVVREPEYDPYVPSAPPVSPGPVAPPPAPEPQPPPPERRVSNCPACGAALGGSRFCTQCGARVL